MLGSVKKTVKHFIACIYLRRSDVSKLEYLTQCVKEGMRLHAPVPMVSRQVEEPLDMCGRKLPPQTLVQINIWALHHMESVWGPDHMEYKPERFSPENAAKMSSYQFMPFSAGSR